MKLLSIVVPSYNSQNYLKRCINSLLYGGDEVEILIIDDGSTDDTAKISDTYQKKYPGIVKAIHQENKGHGGAVNTGIEHATAPFIKVVDSDDWLNHKALAKVLGFLRVVVEGELELDMLICNFVHEKVGAEKKAVMHYHDMFPKNRFFTWNDVKKVSITKYILMHSIIYRTKLLKNCGMKLPEHTFYVDNIYVYYPLPYVKTLYYLDVMFYRYFLGRDDQSVNRAVMTRRLDQQIKVNKILFDSHDCMNIENKKLRKIMLNYVEIVSAITTCLLLNTKRPEDVIRREELWNYMKKSNPRMYRKLRYEMILGQLLNVKSRPARNTVVLIYKICEKIFGY